MMKAEELFGLALRIIGVVLVCYGLQGLLDAGLFSVGYFGYPDSSPNYYLISGLFGTVLGIFLLRGASAIVRFGYPETEDDQVNEEDADPAPR